MELSLIRFGTARRRSDAWSTDAWIGYRLGRRKTRRHQAISARALEIGAMNYRSVASILTNNLDRVASRQSRDEPTLNT
jgi:hypothetical protein